MAEYIEKNVAIARLTVLEMGNPCATMADAKRYIAGTRSADVAPVVHARWEWVSEDIYRCTACNEKAHVAEVMCRPVWGHCPNCGAKMDGGDGNEAN